jgi:hypothetical protein
MNINILMSDAVNTDGTLNDSQRTDAIVIIKN